MLPARHLPVFQQPKVIYFKRVLTTKPLEDREFQLVFIVSLLSNTVLKEAKKV